MFLLSNLNLIPWEFRDFFFNWKGIMLLVGTAMLFSDEQRIPGVIVIAIGGFFLLRDFFEDVLDIDFLDWQVFWPILIIVGGILVIFGRGRLSSFSKPNWDTNTSREQSDDILNVTAVLGGGDISVTSNDFKGGKVTCFMGGGNYDLSNADIKEGPVVIDLFAMFGGGSFIVPSDWKVRIEVTAILGGFSDSRKRLSTVQEGEGHKELIIRGTVIMGGGEIKNFV